ncbi:MAG: hypothetical protein J7L57_02700 [Deltaproteobacteria bacterium]|nr:hypothetical protein [Candidatus Tharpella sp.]
MKNKCAGIVFIFSVIFLALFTCLQAAEPLPDTGQTKCYDNSAELDSYPTPGQPFYGQDAHYNVSERQHSYTKLDQTGSALSV